MPYSMGTDVGTTGTRAVVVRPDGHVVGAATGDHAPMRMPKPGWSCGTIAEGGGGIMATVHAKLTGGKAVLRRDEFEHLVELARRTEPVEVCPEKQDPKASIARLAVEGGAFDFWNESGEDIYSAQDGEAI